MKPRSLAFLFRCAVSIALIAFVLRKLELSAIGALLTRLHFGWALSGWAITSLVIVGLALRWRIFLGQHGIILPFKTILSLTWAGQFFNSLLPGSTGGDVVKIYQVCRLAPDRRASAAATVVIDRLTAVAALFVLAGVAFIIDPLPLRIVPTELFPVASTLRWAIAAFVVIMIGAWLLFRASRGTFWGGRVFRTIAAVKACLSFNASLLAAFSLSVVMHLLNFLVCYVFAKALGITITYLQILLIMPVVLCIVLLPITVNGHGLRELVLVGYFTEMNISLVGHQYGGVREMVIAFSILVLTNDLLWSVPGGIWYLSRFKLSSDDGGSALAAST